jgi:threonine aldolase
MLAEGLASIPGIYLDPSRTRTNIVHFELEDVVELDREGVIARLREDHGIDLSAYPPRYLRAVTHRWVGAAEIDLCLAAIRSIVTPNSSTRGG